MSHYKCEWDTNRPSHSFILIPTSPLLSQPLPSFSHARKQKRAHSTHVLKSLPFLLFRPNCSTHINVISAHPPPAFSHIAWFALVFDITCIICILGIPLLISPHSLHLSFFLSVMFPFAGTSARTRSRPFPEKLSEESQASKTCKHLSLTSANVSSVFFFFFFLTYLFLRVDDCKFAWIPVTFTIICFLVFKSLAFLFFFFFFKPGDKKCERRFQGAE